MPRVPREALGGLVAGAVIAIVLGVAFATARSPRQASGPASVPSAASMPTAPTAPTPVTVASVPASAIMPTAPTAPTTATVSVPSSTITTTPAPTSTTGPTFLRGGSSRLAMLATNRLGLAMLARLSPSQNLAVSPFSVESALAMIDQGALGQTAAQIDHSLDSARRPAALALSNRELGAAMEQAVSGHGRGGPTLDDADGVWLQTGLTPVRAFSTALSENFGAQVQSADFRDNAAGALESVNHWVAGHTADLIQHLLSRQEITAATRLVLANAVSLHARWSDPFDPSDTHPAAFVTPRGLVRVPFMTNPEVVSPYARRPGYVAVGLPYAHSSLQFLAIMPAHGQISRFERGLSLSRLDVISHALRSRPLDLSMPRFTLSFKTQLTGFLQGLGIRRVFSPRHAQLGAMVARQRLFLAFVAHAARLKVDETATTAAAATAGGVSATAVARPTSTIVKLNHPFLVLIRDTRTGAVLFAARVLDPAGATS